MRARHDALGVASFGSGGAGLQGGVPLKDGGVWCPRR
jgi:hypothetical protein